MAILWMNLFIVFISSWCSRYFSRPEPGSISYIKPNKLFILFAILSFVLVSGLRKNIGDTYFYMHSYVIGDTSLSNINYKGDFGFDVLQVLLHQISNNPQILVFTTALVTNVLIVAVLYKYSRMIELSIFLYVTTGMFIVSMNGIRQYFAAAILFTATKFLLEGDWKKYFLIVLFAAVFHKTALIFIPVYFIVRRKAWTKTTLVILLIGVLITAGFNIFSTVLFSALQDTQYGHYADFSARGANIMRAVVDLVPVLIAYLGRERLRELWPKSDYIVNLALLGFIFMVIATKNWLFARFDIYFGLYDLLLLSWVVLIFKKQYQRMIYFGMVFFYTIYFYYEQVITLHLAYRSNYFHW